MSIHAAYFSSEKKKNYYYSFLHAKSTFNLLQIMIHLFQYLSSWQQYNLVSMHKTIVDGVRMQECNVQLFSCDFIFLWRLLSCIFMCNSVTSVV